MKLLNSLFQNSKTTAITIGLFFIFMITGAITYNVAALIREGDYIFNVVNKKHSLGLYRPTDLVELSEIGAPKKYIRKIAYDSLRSLVNDAKKDGVEFKIRSTYRSYETQRSLYDHYTRKYKDADTFSAEAGHSEHQLGTAVDFGSGDSRIDLTEEFGVTKQGKWLEENAWKYGFALSYPKDKESVTGFIYEPWHYRFIGAAAAEGLGQSQLTSAEYLNLAPQYYERESLRGELIQARGSEDVYYVTNLGYKRRIPSEEIFDSYGNRWEDVIFVDPDTFNEIPKVKLIRLEDDYKIYFLGEDDTKQWIEDTETFNKLGYSWEGISLVNKVEFQFYKTGPSLNSASSEKPLRTEENDEYNGEVILFEVPFTAQAPFGNWEDPRQQNGCEEASALMAVRWANASNLELEEARDIIIDASEYEQKVYGEYRSTSSKDSVDRIFIDYFKYTNVRLVGNINTNDIKTELKNGNLVTLPVNGRKLGNPFFTPPGPTEHMLVVIGYDSKTDEFITNDPGTRHGKSFRYKAAVLEDALQDYPTGFKEPIESVNKMMIVVSR